jgi:hypothetical protein
MLFRYRLRLMHISYARSYQLLKDRCAGQQTFNKNKTKGSEEKQTKKSFQNKSNENKIKLKRLTFQPNSLLLSSRFIDVCSSSCGSMMTVKMKTKIVDAAANDPRSKQTHTAQHPNRRQAHHTSVDRSTFAYKFRRKQLCHTS